MGSSAVEPRTEGQQGGSFESPMIEGTYIVEFGDSGPRGKLRRENGGLAYGRLRKC